jgi:dephospho-CoA kinase
LKKNKAFVAALTGGIGSGKSEALKAFAAAGASTLSLDDVARRLAAAGAPAYRRIVAAFGPGVLGADGRIDRKALARLVFSRPSNLKRLEKAVHPLILKEMRRWIARDAGRIKVVDVPLLFEKNLESGFDASVYIKASLQSRRRRAFERDAMSGSEFRRRAKAQINPLLGAARADVVISNDGSKKDLRRTVNQYMNAFELISSAGGRNG